MCSIMIAGMEKQIETKEQNIYDENTAGIGLFYLFKLSFQFVLIKTISFLLKILNLKLKDHHWHQNRLPMKPHM